MQFQESTKGSIQFSTLYSLTAEMFPGITSVSLSRFIKEVFPTSCKKRRGRQKVSYIVGIEKKSPLSHFAASLVGTSTSAGTSTSGMSTSAPLMGMSTSASLASTCMSTPASLMGQSTSASVADTLSLSSQVSALLLELQTERKKRAALELEVDVLKKKLEARSEVESAVDYQHKLNSEIDCAVSSHRILVHGPDTVQHFQDFSMSSVISELQATCPEVYSLVQQLGNTQRYPKDGAMPDEELKGVMAICTLLNARSAKVKGVQLMISLMLVARSAGRQVHVHTNTWKDYE